MGLSLREDVNPQSDLRPRASRILETEYGKSDLFQSVPEEERIASQRRKDEESISKGQYALAFISFFICGVIYLHR